jgi:uncharacterized membrane protein
VPIEPRNIAAILLMGLATYATRAGGLWLIQRMTPSPFLKAWIAHVPGAVFAALCAPMVLKAGPAGWVSAAVALLVARRSGNVFLAMVAGVVAIVLLRAILPAWQPA